MAALGQDGAVLRWKVEQWEIWMVRMWCRIDDIKSSEVEWIPMLVLLRWSWYSCFVLSFVNRFCDFEVPVGSENCWGTNNLEQQRWSLRFHYIIYRCSVMVVVRFSCEACLVYIYCFNDQDCPRIFYWRWLPRLLECYCTFCEKCSWSLDITSVVGRVLRG